MAYSRSYSLNKYMIYFRNVKISENISVSNGKSSIARSAAYSFWGLFNCGVFEDSYILYQVQLQWWENILWESSNPQEGITAIEY